MSLKDENENGGENVHRELDTDDDAMLQIAEIIADLDGRDQEDLTSMWGCIDDVVDKIFSTPPSPEAEAEISFNYEGYRVTIQQDGRATFAELD